MSVNSGCIGVCSTLFDAVCKGCGRTQAEVDGWVALTDEQQQAAVDRAQAAGVGIIFTQGIPI
jgi:predicted Fe-S protein YdhL (DUF1289 family)